LDVSEHQVFHNRLTHTLKVAQVGRRLADRLKRRYGTDAAMAATLNEIDPDVVDAACRAHDLGHPPFGHIGETELQSSIARWNAKRRARRPVNPSLVELDSFEGNAQSFRIATKLAISTVRDGKPIALNLTRATLAAVLKYPYLSHNAKNKKWGAYQSELDEFNFATAAGAPPLRSVEADIMDWADDVTYAVHDFEDFVRAGRIPLSDLRSKQHNLVQSDFIERATARWTPLPGYPPGQVSVAFEQLKDLFLPQQPYIGTAQSRGQLHDFASGLITRYVNDAELLHGRLRIEPIRIVEVHILKQMTWCYVIDNPGLATKQQGQREIVAGLFGRLSKWMTAAVSAPDELRRLPTALRSAYELARAERGMIAWAHQDLELIGVRCVVDYISSLTEQQAVELYMRMTGSGVGAALETWLQV
jgi:dGTPase